MVKLEFLMVSVMSNVPVSIGGFGEVEGGNHVLFSLAAGAGAYLNFTNASTCAAIWVRFRGVHNRPLWALCPATPKAGHVTVLPKYQETINDA
jgi:hypothetical protein